MKFTDIFIRRPVLATVVSLLILVDRPARHAGALPVLQYPRTENAVVTVTTIYYGADPDVIAGFITTPLEQAIAQANGIDYMTSTSQQRRQHDHRQSAAELRLQHGADRDQHQGELGAEPPAAGSRSSRSLTVKVGQTIARCISASTARCWQPNQITDYLVRVVQPKLQAVAGRADGRAFRRQEFRAARLARSAEARRLRPHRRRRERGARRQRLHLGPRQDQGPDGPGQR